MNFKHKTTLTNFALREWRAARVRSVLSLARALPVPRLALVKPT